MEDKKYTVHWRVTLTVVVPADTVELTKIPDGSEYCLDIPAAEGEIDVSGRTETEAWDEKWAEENVREILEDEDTWEMNHGYVQGIDVEWLDAEEEEDLDDDEEEEDEEPEPVVIPKVNLFTFDEGAGE